MIGNCNDYFFKSNVPNLGSNPLCYETVIPVTLKQQSASGCKLLQAGQLSIPHARPALQSASLSQSPSFSPHFSCNELQQDPEFGWVAVHPKCKKDK